VASEETLDCEELLPASCEDIDGDLSAADLAATDGYGYLAFVAYDVTSVKGVEFAVEGFPMGRGGPSIQGPHWCSSGSLTMGDFLDGGGIVSGDCLEPDPVSGLCLGGVIKGETLDLPLCGGGEDMGGREDGGGLVWSMCLDRVDLKTLESEYLDEDWHLLPGRRFPLPQAEVLANTFADEARDGVRQPEFPLLYLRLVVKGEPTWNSGAGSDVRITDNEWYVGFLPVASDGTFPAEGIDWWSWESGRPVEPDKWIRSAFQWRDAASDVAVTFSDGRLEYSSPRESESNLDMPFPKGYVASFDRASHRLAVVGFDETSAEWHLTVVDERGDIVFEDPWDIAPDSHLEAFADSSSLMYAVWEDDAAADARPHVHPLRSGRQRSPMEPYHSHKIGAYRVSLRTGRVAKLPQLSNPPPPPGVPFPGPSQSYSADGRYTARSGSTWHSIAYYDISDPGAPALLWEKCEDRALQYTVVSAGGEYIAEILWGEHLPEGEDGPVVSDFETTVLRIRDKTERELGSQTHRLDDAPYGRAMTFLGPYLIVGYHGRGLNTRCIYIHDMRVPWNSDEGG